MSFGFFCLYSMIIGWLATIVFALLEYFCNNVRVKAFFNVAKKIACGFGFFGVFIIALAAFG